jgi:excisionase family DNA binding protein
MREQERTMLLNKLKPMLCSIPDAATALGVSRSKTYELIGQGQLLTVHIGRRCLVRIDSVEAIAFGEAA